jgi:RNA polymerase sigma-70 factor, ECF subfamily
MPTDALTSLADEVLAAKVAEDPHAFVVLIRRYEERLLWYVRRLGGLTKEDAEDVLQDAFMDAYRHIAEFDVSLKFSSWMYRIAHNRTVSALRKRHKTVNDVSIHDEDAGLERILHSDQASDRRAEATINSTAIRRVLDTLPERDRAVLLLAFAEERSYQEISDILRAPMGTVATWIRRAKQKFEAAVRATPIINDI